MTIMIIVALPTATAHYKQYINELYKRSQQVSHRRWNEYLTLYINIMWARHLDIIGP